MGEQLLLCKEHDQYRGTRTDGVMVIQHVANGYNTKQHNIL